MKLVGHQQANFVEQTWKPLSAGLSTADRSCRRSRCAGKSGGCMPPGCAVVRNRWPPAQLKVETAVCTGDNGSVAKTVQFCALCEAKPASKQGEHVWPQWYLRDQEKVGPGPFAWSHNGSPIINREGVQLAAKDVRMRLKLPACTDCNQALADRFEQPTKQTLRALFSADGALQLSAADAGRVGEWFAKTLLLSIHPQARWAHPAVDAKAIRLKPNEVPPAPFYDWLTTSVPPPDGLSVWLHRTDPADSGSPIHRVPLPSVTVDGVTTDFVEFAVAAHGLCATVVVHPGWPIDHPLEREGTAVRVLPGPADDIDLTALPVLGLRTIQWLRSHLELVPGVLGTAKLPPLRASDNPMALIAEVLPHTVHGWGSDPCLLRSGFFFWGRHRSGRCPRWWGRWQY